MSSHTNTHACTTRLHACIFKHTHILTHKYTHTRACRAVMYAQSYKHHGNTWMYAVESYACARAHIHTHTNTHIHTQERRRMHMHMYILSHTHTHTHDYTHTRIRAHLDSYTHCTTAERMRTHVCIPRSWQLACVRVHVLTRAVVHTHTRLLICACGCNHMYTHACLDQGAHTRTVEDRLKRGARVPSAVFCMCACPFVCIHVCMHTCMHVHMYACPHVCICALTICARRRMHAHV